MSAGTIAMAWIIENQFSRTHGEPFRIITSVVTAISIFAFLLSLLREIVKDIEDIEGDQLINCRSLPIMNGIPFAKTFVLLLSEITLILLLIIQIYLYEYSRLTAVIWLLVSVEIPLIYFLVKMKKAEQKADFHKLSTLLKWIMIGGIGSIVAGQF
jgi:4-hydroxybenzoate polyprenyltransferase